ncbi:hypothetical protein scyTo_0023481, partial [Scyliorhinus torazame]|nr:hypothetical protein [Scyliorhinus torazame]
EKEKFEPTQFQDSIIQGLNENGSDLEAVAKFLDASGAKLDYRRYAETLFDILVAGGMLAPGGTLADNVIRTDVCVFAAQENLETIRAYAQASSIAFTFLLQSEKCKVHFIYLWI